MIKYGLLGDFAFFDWLEANGAAVLARDPDALAHAVARSVEMKAEIVARGRERDRAAAPCSTSATPSATRWRPRPASARRLLHGEAVALGMAHGLPLFRRAGPLLRPGRRRAPPRAIAAAGLPTALAELCPAARSRRTPDRATWRQDKKAEGGRLTFILARGLGEAFVAKDVDAAAVAAFLKQEGAV